MLARPAVGTAGIFTRGRVAGSLALPRSNLTSAAIAFVAVAVVGFDNGGYLAHSWGWMVLAFSSVIAFALLLRPRISLGRLEWIALAALVALATWMFVSGAWGTAGTEPAREAERALVYVSGLGALLTVVETRSVHALLVGIVGATTALALYGLGDRVIEGPAQHPFEGRLLIEPLGYANALGILCAVGLVVAAGLALDERRAIVLLQLAAAAGVLVIALVLTSSRGAWLSLACGLLALGIIRGGGRSWTFLAIAGAIALFLTVLPRIAFGERPAYWRVALEDVRAHPILGSGAGTFDDLWYAYRDEAVAVRDAHSLYLETLAELGPVGLLLLIGVLVPPLVAAAGARSNPTAAAAAGGYVAFIVHAGLDWDWEMPATTLAGLACGTAMLLAAKRA